MQTDFLLPNPYSNNFLISPLLNYHDAFCAVKEAFSIKELNSEAIRKIAIIVVAPFAYLALAFSALIGYIFDSCIRGAAFLSDINIEVSKSLEGLENYAIEQIQAFVAEANILNMENNDFKDDKIKFLNTVVKISEIFKKQEFDRSNNSIDSEIPEFTYHDANDEHFAFAIHSYEFRAAIDKAFLKSGRYKNVTDAIMLDTMEAVVHHRIVEKEDESEDEVSPIELTKAEIELTNNLGKDNPYLVRPFQWVAESSGKIDMLQFRYDFDARELQHASPMNQLLAFRQMAKGVAFVHDQGFIHSDVKPDNFFIEGNIQQGPFEVKVADFGFAYRKSEYINRGALGYSAPEQFKGRAFYKEKIDSFGLGASIYQILRAAIDYFPKNKRNPLRGFGRLLQDEMDGIIMELKEGIRNDLDLLPSEQNLKLQMVDVCASLLVVRPNDRISCHEAAQQLDEISTCNVI